MDFTRALKEVYVANAVFWRARHVDICEIRKLSDSSQIPVGPSNSFSSVLKAHCKRVRQTFGPHIMRAKDTVRNAFHPQGISSQVISIDARQEFLDIQERKYQPPDVPAIVTFPHAATVLRGPVARPADGLDLDAIFENLGLCDKPGKEKPEKDLQP